MVRNAQKMISRMFFIVGYFGGKRGVENIHTIFFEGFPNWLANTKAFFVDTVYLKCKTIKCVRLLFYCLLG